MALNFYKIYLESLSIAFQYDITFDVLHELHKTIERVSNRTFDITKGVSQDIAELIWEDTNAAVDDLHGAAFVICQAAITSIVSRVKTLHKFAQSAGNAINSVPNDKGQLLAFKSAVIPSKTVTQVEAIDALANYFKHHDEWRAGWADPDARSKAAIATLQALGFQYGNSAILRNAVTLFESDLLALVNAVNVWHEAIVAELRKELISLGLL